MSNTVNENKPAGKHTPGVLRVIVDESAAQVTGFPCIETDEYVVVGTEGMYGDIDTDFANARRIAAAWNACDGIPTDALEADAIKDLLEALRPFAACADELDAEKEWDNEEWAKFRLLVRDYRAARAAIAKAEGQSSE